MGAVHEKLRLAWAPFACSAPVGEPTPTSPSPCQFPPPQRPSRTAAKHSWVWFKRLVGRHLRLRQAHGFGAARCRVVEGASQPPEVRLLALVCSNLTKNFPTGCCHLLGPGERTAASKGCQAACMAAALAPLAAMHQSPAKQGLKEGNQGLTCAAVSRTCGCTSEEVQKWANP